MAAFREFKMGWKKKVLAFHVLESVPMGGYIYYLLQRYVTKVYPRRLDRTDEAAVEQLGHLQRISSARGYDRQDVILEFGAGWDLYSSFLYYCMGIDRQIVVDLNRWARADLINDVIEHLSIDPPAGAVRRPQYKVSQANLEQDLLRYGIAYRAPYDATRMDLEENSVDIIITTSVLEHIPPPDLKEIIANCRRVLRPDGIMSHVVDHSDHYSHSDGNITPFNYLSFSESAWKKYNPGIHFQNRLRAQDYRDIFVSEGFRIIDEKRWFGSQDDLESVDVNSEFSKYERDELRCLGASYLLS